MLPTVTEGAPVRLLVLGDSLSAGYGLAQPDGFEAQLGAALRAGGHDVAIVDGAVSGDTLENLEEVRKAAWRGLTGRWATARMRPLSSLEPMTGCAASIPQIPRRTCAGSSTG